MNEWVYVVWWVSVSLTLQEKKKIITIKNFFLSHACLHTRVKPQDLWWGQLQTEWTHHRHIDWWCLLHITLCSSFMTAANRWVRRRRDVRKKGEEKDETKVCIVITTKRKIQTSSLTAQYSHLLAPFSLSLSPQWNFNLVGAHIHQPRSLLPV